jgi:hypothetical protein
MTQRAYQPDEIREPADLFLLAQAGPEPQFDAVTLDFLLASHSDLDERRGTGDLLDWACLGRTAPWLYRLTFRTCGLVRSDEGQIEPVERHVIALRFQPDYLRRADRFEMLRYLEPRGPFHPNICPRTGAICVEIYPGEPLMEILQSLHDLLRWRLRQLAEHDALNPDACSYGRQAVHHALDERSLFPRRSSGLLVEPLETSP